MGCDNYPGREGVKDGDPLSQATGGFEVLLINWLGPEDFDSHQGDSPTPEFQQEDANRSP
ncbi:hypothetical protein FRC09_017287, partial [Ceratobasidium sp. 395]